MIVSMEDAFRISICVVVAGQLPHDDCFIYMLFDEIGIKCSMDRDKIPREAVKIMSGFSEEVAIAVTQPLWPANEPRKRNCSAMLLRKYEVQLAKVAVDGEFGLVAETLSRGMQLYVFTAVNNISDYIFHLPSPSLSNNIDAGYPAVTESARGPVPSNYSHGRQTQYNP